MGDRSLDLELEALAGRLEWLQGLAVSLVSDIQAAEDLVQKAIQEALAKGGWEEGKLQPWLAGTVRNLAKQYFRTERRRRRREERVVEMAQAYAAEVGAAEEATTPDRLAEQVECQELLTRTVLDLEEPYRRTVLLFYFGNKAQREIAAEEGISLRAVETRLRRGRQRLRSVLQNRYGKDSWLAGVLPLILKVPPPASPPPLVAAGPGSLGLGWWGSGALLLGIGLILLGPFQQAKDGEPMSSQVAAHDAAPTADTTGGALQRTDLETVSSSSDSGEADEAERIQGFQVVERETGKPVPGQRLRVMFVRDPDPYERLQQEHHAHFRPRDRVWWSLGRTQGFSAADGTWSVPVPQGATRMFVDLGIHNATHSLVEYGKGFRSYALSTLPQGPVRLEMVLRTGAASGYVLDDQGNPLGDTVVDVFHDSSAGDASAPTTSVLTSSDGEFRIPNIACDQGPFRLRPRRQGHVPTKELRVQRYAGFGVDYPGISLEMTPADTETVVEVTTPDGSPLAEAEVQVFLPGSPRIVGKYGFGTYYADWRAFARTDGEGRARLHEVPAADLVWQVDHPQYRPWKRELPITPQRLPVRLDAGGAWQVEVRSEGGPVEGASVGAHGSTTRVVGRTDEDGRILLPALPAGEALHLVVAHPEHALWVSPPTWVVPNMEPTLVTLEPGLTLSGQVVPGEGEGPPTAQADQVFLRPRDAPPLTPLAPEDPSYRPSHWLEVAGLDAVGLDAEGRFRFQGLPEMDVELWYGMRRRPLGFATAHAGAEDVLLTPGGGMEAYAEVALAVQERSSGRPVTTYYLHWQREDPGMERSIPGVAVEDPAGRHVQRGLEPGSWSVVVWAPQGYTTRRISAQDFAAGRHTLDVTLDAARSLRLRVEDTEGVPLEGVEVSVLDLDGDLLLQTGFDGSGLEDHRFTDARGQLPLSNVPAERAYRIRCRWRGQTHHVELPGAQVERALRVVTLPVSR